MSWGWLLLWQPCTWPAVLSSAHRFFNDEIKDYYFVQMTAKWTDYSALTIWMAGQLSVSVSKSKESQFWFSNSITIKSVSWCLLEVIISLTCKTCISKCWYNFSSGGWSYYWFVRYREVSLEWNVGLQVGGCSSFKWRRGCKIKGWLCNWWLSGVVAASISSVSWFVCVIGKSFAHNVSLVCI